MEERNNGKLVAVIALCIAIIGLSVGFAALSTQLNITGSGIIGGSSWSVIYREKNGGAANYTTHSTSTDADLQADKGTVTFNPATTDLNITGIKLYSPGDFVEYRFEVANVGTYNAVIGSVNPLQVTCTGDNGWCTENNNLQYSLVYDDTNQAPTVGDQLAKESGVKTLILKVGLNEAATSVPSANVTINISHSMNYVQQ